MQVVAATDAQLIRRAHEDSEALATLYLRYRDRLYAWFRARAPEAAASELTAELFAQVALGLKRFRDEADGSAAPWLYGIARNLLRRYHEHGRLEDAARRRLGMPFRSYEDDFAAVDERLTSAAVVLELHSTLESLPKPQREALTLRVVDGLSYEEVASALDCSETAARLRVMRALGRLRSAQRPA
jgi:RNA polymerase sigma-70 factor (ECF subfamily)